MDLNILLYINNMDFETFYDSTYSRDKFKIVNTNNNGSCCYDSILKLLKINKKIKPNINTKIIQSQAVNWIIKNKELYLPNYNLTVEDYVLYTHQFDNFDEYVETYKKYSGKTYENISHDRWGGIPELIALSYIYNININIYTGKSYNKNKNKIIKGTIINGKPRKDFRYQLLLNTTRNEFNNTYNILYIQNGKSSHFVGLIMIT
jgi:hypothetical protein